MNQISPIRSATAVAVLALLAGCSTVGSGGTPAGGQGSAKVDYRSQAAKTPPLEVPPDLTQLSREGRFAVQGGQAVSISASTFGQAGSAAAPASATTGLPAVTPTEVGPVRLVRDGAVRRLVTPLAPEIVYQRALAFWKDAGFNIEIERPEAGIIETGWAENRAKLPQDFMRNLLGRFADGLFSTGERDRYRTVIERTAQGTEIRISHRGLVEAVTAADRGGTTSGGWQPRPADPELESEFTYRLMARLGAPEAQVQQARSADAAAGRAGAQTGAAAARSAAPAAAAAAGAAGAADRVRALPDGRLEVAEEFDRAWRRVGLALDRSGFTVEDRDRAGGIYFVRYIDKTGNPNPGVVDRVLNIFRSDDSKSRLTRYRIVLKREGDARTTVSVLNQSGQPESSAAARQVMDVLAKELR